MNRERPDIIRYIDDMYETLSQIRRNMNSVSISYHNNNRPSFGVVDNTTRDILQSYTQTYRETLRHIEYLYELFDQQTRVANRGNARPNARTYVSNRGQNTRENGIGGVSIPQSPIPTGTQTTSVPVTPRNPRNVANSTRQSRARPRNVNTSHRNGNPTPYIHTPRFPTNRYRVENPSGHVSNTLLSPFANIFETATTGWLESLTPVIVRPTQQQITRSTRRMLFGEIVNPMNTQCSISLETFVDTSPVIQITHCGHIFNPESFQRWFEGNVRCPVCRHDIRSTSPTDRNENRDPATMSASIPENSATNASTSTPTPERDQTTARGTANYDVSWTQSDVPVSTDLSSTQFAHSVLNNDPDAQRILNTYIQQQMSSLGIGDFFPVETIFDASGATMSSLPEEYDAHRSASEMIISTLADPSNELVNAGQQILTNLLTNNVNNLSYDQSNNIVTFDTIISGIVRPDISGNIHVQSENDPYIDGVD